MDQLPDVREVGVLYFSAEAYDRCLAMFSDGKEFPRMHEEYRARAQAQVNELIKHGIEPIWVRVDPVELKAWCTEHKFADIDARARCEFAADQVRLIVAGRHEQAPSGK
jgi:hypothetical protein